MNAKLYTQYITQNEHECKALNECFEKVNTIRRLPISRDALNKLCIFTTFNFQYFFNAVVKHRVSILFVVLITILLHAAH